MEKEKEMKRNEGRKLLLGEQMINQFCKDFIIDWHANNNMLPTTIKKKAKKKKNKSRKLKNFFVRKTKENEFFFQIFQLNYPRYAYGCMKRILAN